MAARGGPERSRSLALNGEPTAVRCHGAYWRLDYSHPSSFLTAVIDSRYSVVEGDGLTNLLLGLRRGDGRWDFALLMRNMLDVDFFQQRAVRSTGWIAAVPSDHRSMGLAFRDRY